MVALLWQVIFIVVNTSIYASVALSLIAGLGGLLEFYIPQYRVAGYGQSAILALIILPVIFMGIGCFSGYIALKYIGRRKTMILSSLLLVLASGLCASAQSYRWHLGARLLLGIAAGHTEVFIPVMIQECQPFTKRSRSMLIQQGVQTTLTTILIIFAGPIAARTSPRWWYGIGSCLAAAQSMATIIFHPETLAPRSDSTIGTIGSSLGRRIATVPADTPSAPQADSHTPNAVRKKLIEYLMPYCSITLLWAISINGISIASNILLGAAYGRVLASPPYQWPDKDISYSSAGQILVSLIAIPFFGHASDWLMQHRTKQTGGHREPRMRLLIGILPSVVGFLANLLFGIAMESPTHFHWFVIVWCLAAANFSFVGANNVTFTYLLDYYGDSAELKLAVVCALRNFTSVGIVYGTIGISGVDKLQVAFYILAALTLCMGISEVALYFRGMYTRESAPDV